MTNKEDINFILQILELRTKILDSNLQEIGRGYYGHIKEKGLKTLDLELSMLVKSILKYDFISQINSGHSLLVGEGNLSFTISLIKKLQQLSNLATTTYENYEDLSDAAQFNTRLLKQKGINVLHGIDATRLPQFFSQDSFDTVIFQFPHSGSREYIEGLNPNYILVRDFIVSASYILKDNGIILITTVDTDFYNNTFRFNEVSQELKIQNPNKYKFDPKDYPEYEHTMTHQEESGIDGYCKFATWEFRI